MYRVYNRRFFSKFDGSFDGSKTTNNRGFVAWVARGSSLVIENSVFAPASINTKFEGCDTWVGLDTENVEYSGVNNYATRVYSNTQAYIINNVADWNQFVKMVEEAKNQYNVNAILANDITVSTYAGGGEAAAFRGTFDGMGHTLTFNYNSSAQYIAPFRYVGAATFKNLHVAGTIKTNSKYAGGFVGKVVTGGSAVFENCRSSVTLNTSVSGDATMGGFVGVVNSNAHVTFRNCVFDGRFEGSNSSHNGGFVGWTNGPVTIENCLFMPAYVDTNPEGSETWARNSENVTFTVTNSYATNEFCHIINNASDWETFRKALDNRGNKSVNAILNADITISTSAESFSGVFDGNGHKFTNGGYYKSAAGHNFTDDVANTYFYDATKVKLTGRVVGGNEQGSKPLMNNLSKNNLGDSLTMVLTLEGDNTSWLVYDNLNPNRTERREVIRHSRNGNKHYTTVTTQRKRMTVLPDEATGEYELLLPPVRWKVQQVYCKGYPTLFQEGQVSEVIDLTDCLTEKDTTYVGSYKDIDTITVVDPKVSCHAIYNRIYHNPVEVTYKQLGYDTFDYFGDKNYIATELSGEAVEVPLAYLDPTDSVTVRYTFEHPVFSVERKYTIDLQVGVSYPYNNDPTRDIDIVLLGGGMAMMQNGLDPSPIDKPDEPVQIDSLGRARFTLSASQTPTLLTGENALKTVTFTVMRDGTFIEAKPLQGYVLNMFPVGESTELLTDGQPLLFDILRDPPGSYSTNTLAKGATLNYTYMMNLSLTAGVIITYKDGKKLQTLSATVVAPQGSGTAVGPISAGETQEGTIDQLLYTAQGSKAFSYTMAISNNISTSGDPSMVGADADLYIGAVQNVVVTPMSTIRAVPKKMYNQIAARQGGVNEVSEVAKNIDYGTLVKIAEGTNADGDTICLIRDVALGYGPKIKSQFIYSQKQILTQIIPDKAKEIVDMMFCGTKAEAQNIADKTGRPVYWSLREPTDTMFAVVNKKLSDRPYNDYIDKAEKGINYMVVIPKGTSRDEFNDEVTEKYQILKAWTEMIAQNEFEKLHADNLVTNYDIAGAQGVNYSETFDNNYSESWTHHFPIATEVDFFGPGISYAASFVSIGATIVGSYLASMAEMEQWTSPGVATSKTDITKDQGWNATLEFGGKLSQWTIIPVALYQTVGATTDTKAYNRTESFTIAADPMSRLSVDVYRVMPVVSKEDSALVGVTNIFTNYNFNTYGDEVKKFVNSSLKAQDILGPRGFVFRTRGGATQNPWEDKRTTLFYDTGRTLDERTLKICNPKIRLDKQSVSGVSVNDAAHFKVYVSNESEKPEATEGLTVLQLFAVDQANSNGAKISVNGQPLTTGGMTISVVPGMETQLDMEVRAGQGFDFDGLTIGVMSPNDPVNTEELVSFNVHFLREAGGVNIAVPSDKWVLITYLGFDRIERQKDNDLELVPYAYSKKLYLDDKGQPRYQLNPLTKEPTDTLVRDYLFVDEEAIVKQHFDPTMAAPVVPYEEVKNLKFSFIGKDNQVMVELDEPAARLNHCNIYVTLRNIDDKNQCHGYANISHDTQNGDNGLYLTVYDDQSSGRELNFRLWQYSTGREIVLTTKPAITFTKDAMLGADKPVRFDGGEAFVQNFKLKAGWNWVSFNVNSDQLNDVNKLLSSMQWSDGDILTDMSSDTTLNYEAAQKQWIASGSTAGMVISPKKSYAIKVKNDCTFPIRGTIIKTEDDRTIKLEQGWNAIGYTPMTNLTVETALSDYYDQAEQGDVIKSHTEFAYFTKAGNTGRWRGNLQYMKPGEGYMMLRKSSKDASFTYPFHELGSNFYEDMTASDILAAAPRHRSTMSVSAVTEGFETEEGDRLVAYANGEAVGEATVRKVTASDTAEPLYLSITGDLQQGIWFAIERDGEIVAATAETMAFNANAVIGTPDEPTTINFVKAEYENGKWYTVSGILLQKKPTQKGIYIFNGKKVLIK